MIMRLPHLKAVVVTGVSKGIEPIFVHLFVSVLYNNMSTDYLQRLIKSGFDEKPDVISCRVDDTKEVILVPAKVNV